MVACMSRSTNETYETEIRTREKYWQPYPNFGEVQSTNWKNYSDNLR